MNQITSHLFDEEAVCGQRDQKQRFFNVKRVVGGTVRVEGIAVDQLGELDVY